MMNKRNSLRTALALAIGLGVFQSTPTLHAQNGTWITDASSNWTTGANWLGGIIANGTDNTAFFTAELTTATRNVTLGADRTIGNITFTDGATSSNNLVITGANTLTLDVTTGAPIINVTQSDRVLAFDSVTAGNDGLTKIGQGLLAMRNASTYTGATTVNGGTFDLGFGSAVGSLASTSLVIGGGTFAYTRTGITTQTFSSGTTINAGRGVISTIAGNTLNLGALTRNAGGSLNVLTPGTITTTTANDASGILGGWAIIDSANWAVANGGASAITAFAGYTALPTSGGSATTNYNMTAATTLTGSFSVNSLKLDAPAGNLAIGANTLTIESGGLLSTGSTAVSITGDTLATRLTAGSGSNYNLVVHQYNAGGLTIGAVIGNNGANAVSLVKSGTGNLTLAGANTYTGNTYINQGTLTMASVNLIPNSPTIFLGDSATLSLATGFNNNFTLAAGQSIQGTGATGAISIGNNTGNGLITTNNTTINTTGTLTIQRLDVKGTGNQLTGGNIVAGVGGGSARRGLLVGNGSNGTFTIAGGTFTTVAGAAADILGANGAFTGTLVINGGSYVNSGTVSFGADVGTTSSGVLTLNSGSATIGTILWNTLPASGTGIINLNGGTLTLSAIGSTSGLTKEFNFNSGQFVAGAALTMPTALTLNVKDGGALINTNGFNPTISGSLVNFGGSSTGGLTKSGAGTLILSAGNTYAGNTLINVGALNIRSSSALGSIAGGTTVAAGAALEMQNNITVVDEALTLNGTGVANGGALRNISDTNIYSGPITLGTATRINSDAGSLTLNNASPITGAGLALTVGGVGNTTISSIIGTTTGSVIKDGTGTLTLSGANTFSGGLQAAGGTVNLSTTASAAGSGTINFNTGGATNASVLVSTALTIANPVTVSAGSTGTNTLGSSGNVAVTFSSPITLNNNLTLSNGGNAQLRVGDAAITGTGGLLTAGSGTGVIVIANAHTYTGGFTLGGSGLIVPVGSSLGPDGNPTSGPFGAGSTPTTLGTGRIRATTGSDTTIRNTLTLAGNVTVPSVADEKSLIFTGPATLTGNRTFTADVGTTVAGKSLTFSGAIGDAGNAFGLAKAGTGVMVLSGANTYTGVTSVSAGRLVVNGSTTSNTDVLANATLGGSGTITGNVSGAGNVAPGNSIGTLNIVGDYNVTGLQQFELAAGLGALASSDKILGLNALTYGGTLQVSAASGSFTLGDSWDLFGFVSQSGTFANNGDFGIAGGGGTLPTLGAAEAWNFNYNTGVLSIAVIPEPSTLVLGGLALLGFAGVGLRRRRLIRG